tara:strand:- start:833 stop:1744 length:912 start_codon:yes stop_codon:yes gene_type:complete
MKTYSFEKGKHGGPTGVIFPFFADINGLIPVDQDYRDLCPAGFLKCRGQILQADQFPALAEVLGVGNQCIYRKDGTTLEERSEDGTGGTFQLPDLGSKYITAASNSGQYLNSTTKDEDNNIIDRAGVAVTLDSSGDSIEFSYTGEFSAPAVTLSFTGQWRFVQPPSRTPETTLTIGNFVAHGHLGSYTIAQRINLNSQGMRQCAWAGGYPCFQPSGKLIGSAGDRAVGVQLVNISFNDAGIDSAHDHGLGIPSINVTGPTSTIPAVTLGVSGVTTTVNMRVRDLAKMDDISPKFVITEYLIKF